jgi:hypothetical protein
MVESLTHNPNIKGFNPATGAWAQGYKIICREKITLQNGIFYTVE